MKTAYITLILGAVIGLFCGRLIFRPTEMPVVSKTPDVEECHKEGGRISIYTEDQTTIRLLCSDATGNDLFEIKIVK